MYPEGFLQSGEHREHYIHCNGTQLKLSDSNFGQGQYQPTDYYVWTSRNGEQLLFIFPTSVSLTTITLHYYSDRAQGLPTLIFYDVPEDFDVWDLPITSYPHVDVAEVQPGGEPAGHKSVNITVDFKTKKLLIFIYGSNFKLAVSEAQFFKCSCKLTIN